MSRLLKLEDEYLLLRSIDDSKEIDGLAVKYSYVSIAIEIRGMIEEGYLTKNERNLVLTEAGKAQLEHLEKAILMTHKGWIFPKKDEKISPINENDVYLPSNLGLLD